MSLKSFFLLSCYGDYENLTKLLISCEGDSQVLAILLISCDGDSYNSAIKNVKVRKSRFLPMAISL